MKNHNRTALGITTSQNIHSSDFNFFLEKPLHMLLENLYHIYIKCLTSVKQNICHVLKCTIMNPNQILIVVCDAQILHMMNQRIYFHCTKTGIHMELQARLRSRIRSRLLVLLTQEYRHHMQFTVQVSEMAKWPTTRQKMTLKLHKKPQYTLLFQ